MKRIIGCYLESFSFQNLYILYHIFLNLDLAFGNEMKVTHACFNLPVFYDCTVMEKPGNCSVGDYLYDLKSIKETIDVQLNCPNKNDYIQVIYAEYAIPALMDHYCLDKDLSCTKTSQCNCCTEPLKETDLCYIASPISKVAVERCKKSEDTCTLSFRRTIFNGQVDCPNLKYPCTVGNEDSWCNSRWLIVYYECVFNNSLVPTKRPIWLDRDLYKTAPPLKPSRRVPVNTRPRFQTTTTTQKPAEVEVNGRVSDIPNAEGYEDKAMSTSEPTGQVGESPKLVPLSTRVQSSEMCIMIQDWESYSGWLIGMLIVITFVCGTAVIICITIIVFFVREMAHSLRDKHTTNTHINQHHRSSNPHTQLPPQSGGPGSGGYGDIYYREISQI